MIMVNYDKGFAEMLQHPAFRKSPPTADARGRDDGVRQELAAGE
jgi:hypothetical protein